MLVISMSRPCVGSQVSYRGISAMAAHLRHGHLNFADQLLVEQDLVQDVPQTDALLPHDLNETMASGIRAGPFLDLLFQEIERSLV